MKHCKLFAALIALLVVACEDELVPKPEASEKIGYSVSVNSNGWQLGTRSADSLRMPRITIEPLEQKLGGKPVYLHTVVENTIPDNIKTATDSSAAGTRGSIVTTGGVTELSVSAYVSNSDTWSDADAKLYMQNVKSTSPNWTTNYFWPTTQSFIRFFAYSPAVALENGLTTTVCPPTFSYTVEDNIQAQADLLVASAQYAGNYCQPAHLEFGHALTAVTIKLKDMDQFTIKSLTLSGVKKSGTYTYSYNVNGDSQGGTATHDAGTWTESGEATASYTYYFGTDADNKLVVATEQGELTGYTYTTGAGEVTLNEGILTLLLMPQTLTAGAQITVTGTDQIIDKEVNLTAAIGVDSEGSSKTWEKGKHVTYTLSLKDQTVTYVFNVEPDTTTPVTASSVPWYGATGLQYKVTDSYKIITRGNNQSDPIPVEWKVTYPSWVDETIIPGGTLQDGIVSNSDKNNAKVGTYGVVTTNYESVGSGGIANHTSHEELIIHPHLGSETSPHDLSDPQGKGSPQHTANCYVVSAPGYYKLPLVYGNAIVDGIENKNAYHTDAQEETVVANRYDTDGNVLGERSVSVGVLTDFVDHKDEKIQGPWVVKSGLGLNGGQGYTANSAEIVWQDEPCLLTEVKLCGADYLQFRVREDCITEGNAVVAVKNSEGVIMWSWHIWVTDFRNIYDNGIGVVSFNAAENVWELGSMEVTNRKVKDDSNTANWLLEENTFSLLPAHLGHCDGEKKTYSARTGEIAFVQIENDEVITNIHGTLSGNRSITISQEGYADSDYTNGVPDNAVYYQYGRKDPMVAALGNGTNKPCYGNDRKPIDGIKESKAGEVSLGTAIQNPNVYYGRTSTATNNYLQLSKWCKEWKIYNLWNANSNVLPMFTYFPKYEEGKPADFFDALEGILDIGVTKTIYDPSPPGYEMPRMDAFTGFTYDGIRRGQYFDGTNMKASVNVMLECITEPGTNGYNGLSFFRLPMEQKDYYKRAEGEDETFFVQALGHRNNKGTVVQFNNYGAALTATPICVQWLDAKENYFKLELSRLCFILNNWSTLRPISTTALDYAFGIMPAKTGKNPDSSKNRTVDETTLKAEYAAKYPNAR